MWLRGSLKPVLIVLTVIALIMLPLTVPAEILTALKHEHHAGHSSQVLKRLHND